MRFGIVTDELSEDPREAIDIALEWGIRDFEIRSVGGTRFPRFQDNTLDRLAALREEYEINYSAVSPGFFKHSMEDETEIAYALGEGLNIAMDFMEGCDIPTLICFGFDMDPGTDDEAVRHIKVLADRLEERNLCGAIENETHCKFNTPARIADLLRRVGRPNLGANWDLGNLKQGAPEGYPEGYERVKRHILNVHAKDVVVKEDGSVEWKPIGQGICDWAGQIRALEHDDIVDVITLENHCGPPKEVGLHNLNTLKAYLEEGA